MKTNPTLQQAMLIEIIQHRLREQQRQELLRNVAQAEKEYTQGNFRRGSVDDLMAELAKVEEM